MSLRPILWISVALNLGLTAAVIWQIRRQTAASPTPPAVSRRGLALTPAQTNATPQPSRLVPDRPGPPFLWSQIASEDLKIYRDNLRAVGCPELTVREIILSEINERFGPRRRDLLATLQNKFWDLALHGELSFRRMRAPAAWQQPLDALVAERQKMINDVLGINYVSAGAVDEERHEDFERKFAWLPEDKRDKLLALEAERERRLTEWAQKMGSRESGPTAAENEAFQKLQQEFEDDRGKLLTPEELKELRLRDSSVADWPGSLPGFEPTEDEWRSMAERRLQFEDAQSKLGGPDVTDEEREAQQNEIQAKFDSDLKQLLGADRFAAYELANNGQYQEVRNVTQRYGLPDQVAVQAFQIEQAAIAQANQVRQNPNLSPDTRQSVLNSIQQETERTLNGTLGAKVFSTYKQYGGDWLRGLVQTE